MKSGLVAVAAGLASIHRPSALAFAVGVLLLATSCAKRESFFHPDGGPNEIIWNALARSDGVFATCNKGLFHSPPGTKQWVQLSVGDSAPIGGLIAGRTNRSASIYYYTPIYHPWGPTSDQGKVFGLYRSDNAGKNWALTSTEYDFQYVYVHEDNAVYAITHRSPDGTNSLAQVLVSLDAGRHWRNITDGIRAGELYGIFPDPDHKELVCVLGNSIRPIFYRASDTNYEWKVAPQGFQPQRASEAESDDAFLQPNCSGSPHGIGSPTLAAYFDLPFAGRTSAEVPHFEIETKPGFVFKRSDPVIVPVQVTVWGQVGVWGTNGGVTFPPNASVDLLDQTGGNAFWSVRCITPDRKRESPPASGGVARDSSDVHAHPMKTGQSYERKLDLSSLCDFSKVGIYRVQVTYDSRWIAKLERGEWWGSFAGPAFQIKIAE